MMATKVTQAGCDLVQGEPARKAPVLVPVKLITWHAVKNYKG